MTVQTWHRNLKNMPKEEDIDFNQVNNPSNLFPKSQNDDQFDDESAQERARLDGKAFVKEKLMTKAPNQHFYESHAIKHQKQADFPAETLKDFLDLDEKVDPNYSKFELNHKKYQHPFFDLNLKQPPQDSTFREDVTSGAIVGFWKAVKLPGHDQATFECYKTYCVNNAGFLNLRKL